MSLPEPSQEQYDIVKHVANGIPVYVDAVAGSGKTTTVCHIAKECSDKSILLITYNKHLKFEVRHKMLQNNITNVTIHTYHSTAVTFYDRCAYTDDKLKRVIDEDKCILKEHSPVYDIMIIDEAQDMTLLYYSFVHKFIRDCNITPIMVIMGDKHQSIYAFNGSDSRFLTLSMNDIYPKPTEYVSFMRKTLKISYRVTSNIAWFVNNVMLGQQRLFTTDMKIGTKVDYIISNSFRAYEYIFGELYPLLKSGKISPEDIFVLSPSIKKNGTSKTPVGFLENKFVENGIPCFVPVSDNGNLDDDIIKGKVVFTTFHQSKGRERPIVIVYNFDSSYFKYYNKDDEPYICPSTMYVAATRASQRLMVIEDTEQHQRLPFIKMSYTEMITSGSVKIINQTRKSIYHMKNCFEDEPLNYDKEPFKNVVVTDIVKYIKQEVLTDLQKAIEILFTSVKQIKRKIRIPSKVSSTVPGLYEEVSTINALSITAFWEYKYTNNIDIYKRLVKNIQKTEGSDLFDEVVYKAFKTLNYPCQDISDYMKLALLHETSYNGYHFKLAQIANYDWLTDKMVSSCVKRIEENIDYRNEDNIQIEYVLEGNKEEDMEGVAYQHREFGKLIFKGRVDIMTDEAIWEIKCVDELQIEHYLQVILYEFIWSILCDREDKPKKKFYILNIRTGEVKELIVNNMNSYLIQDVINTILSAKFGRSKSITNEEFLEKCRTLSFMNINK